MARGLELAPECESDEDNSFRLLSRLSLSHKTLNIAVSAVRFTP